MSDKRTKKIYSEAKDARQMQPENDEWEVTRRKKRKYDCEIQQRYIGPLHEGSLFGRNREWHRERKSNKKHVQEVIQKLRSEYLSRLYEYRVVDYD
jgi:hypothetical protein